MKRKSPHHVIVFGFFGLVLLPALNCDGPHVDPASLPLEHRAVYGPSHPSSGFIDSQAALPNVASNDISDEAWPLSASNDSPQIKHLQVQCEKTHMRVNIEFDRPFYGMIFSKGFYSDPHCVHLKPGTGHLSATFEIFLNSCGMTSSANHNAAGYGLPTPSGSFVENTIIIQYDPYVQEVWDQARKLRCTWYDFYEKAVTFRPFQVDMLHAVTANFLGDNLQCWMQIQVGKGPWASEVSGIVKIGQTMTMVLAIKDDENKFDMLVRNCVAHDGKRAPIQLVDQNGCVVRPKIMSKFQKIKNFGPSASVVSFAYFQAFKFPDSMNVHFQCVIQVCRFNCPEPKCGSLTPNSEFGLPQIAANSAEISTQEAYDRNDYQTNGIAPAPYPDPRHQAIEVSGAFSEQQPDVIPLPQAQSSSITSSSGLASPQTHKSNGANMLPPPLPGQAAQYSTVKGPEDTDGGNLISLGGRPRSVEGLDDLRGVRKRRGTLDIDIKPRIYKRNAQEMTDINTSRIIQVVAPGDVNFALNSHASNETVVIQSARSSDTESICMSIPSFVGGLVVLLLVLAISSLVAAFLFVRVRHFDRKSSSLTYAN